MRIRHVVATDKGRERKNNEDAARALPELGLFVIADGMGGHVGGEVASRVATDTFVAFVKGQGPANDIPDEARLLSEAIIEANSAVQHEASARGLHGMGTTLTALRLHGKSLTVCHVGDTRAYFLREGELKTQTQDHTVVSMLVEEGIIDEDQAREHPERHMLTQALGTQELIEPDVVQLELPGSLRILLSTDGLHDVVPPSEIAELGSLPSLKVAAQSLIDRANELGGPDNITVVLIEP